LNSQQGSAAQQENDEQTMILAEQYVAIVDLIYATVLDDDLWPAALSTIQNTLSGSGSLLGIDKAGQLTMLEACGYSTQAVDSFVQGYASNAYISGLLSAARDGTLARDPYISTPERLRTDPSAGEWAARHDTHDMIVVCLLKRDATTAFAMFGRSATAGAFEAAELDFMGRLAPHLQRAVAMRVELDRARVQSSTSFQAVDSHSDGFILIGDDSSVMYANPAATRICSAAGTGLEIRRSHLAALKSSDNAALQALIARATGMDGGKRAGGLVRIGQQNGLRPLTLFCLTLSDATTWNLGPQATAAFFIADASHREAPSTKTLSSLFHLTAAEARLASRLFRGATLMDAAAEFGVGKTTVETHLKAIFLKTNTNRQAELIALLHAIPKLDILRDQRLDASSLTASPAP
jgi:DNA-binding CsgD family transcriptional regulator